MNDDIPAEDLRLLETLEEEGVLTKETTKKVRRALRVQRAAAPVFSKATRRLLLVFLACTLGSAAIGLNPLGNWLSFLLGSMGSVLALWVFFNTLMDADL
jgi:hypothetical protein